MAKRETTKPFTLFFLLLPYGISTGFASITLPFFLTRAGFSVASAAAIVALGVSSNVWLFCWGPIVDLTLTPRRWYLLAVVAAAATLFLLGIIPFQQNAVAILSAMVLVSQIAVSFVVLPMGALMAYTVPDDSKGRAAVGTRQAISAVTESAAASGFGSACNSPRKSPAQLLPRR